MREFHLPTHCGHLGIAMINFMLAYDEVEEDREGLGARLFTPKEVADFF